MPAHLNLPTDDTAYLASLEAVSHGYLTCEINYLWRQYERAIGYTDPLNVENRERAYALCVRVCAVRDRRFGVARKVAA